MFLNVFFKTQQSAKFCNYRVYMPLKIQLSMQDFDYDKLARLNNDNCFCIRTLIQNFFFLLFTQIKKIYLCNTPHSITKKTYLSNEPST